MSESKKVLKRISEVIDNIETIVDEAGMDAEIWKENSDLLKSLKNKKPLKKKPADKTEVQSNWDKAMKDPKKGPEMIEFMYQYLLDHDMFPRK
jgi:hypothetical protein